MWTATQRWLLHEQWRQNIFFLWRRSMWWTRYTSDKTFHCSPDTVYTCDFLLLVLVLFCTVKDISYLRGCKSPLFHTPLSFNALNWGEYCWVLSCKNYSPEAISWWTLQDASFCHFDNTSLSVYSLSVTDRLTYFSMIASTGFHSLLCCCAVKWMSNVWNLML